MAALTVHVVALWLMFVHRADRDWDRMMYVLGGFEAIVFAAIGALFGTSARRASVRAAARNETERARPERSRHQDRAGQAPAKAAPEER